MRPRTITRTTIALALSLVICASLQASDKKYILENDALRITFADSSSGFDCLSITNRLAGNKRFVDPSGDDLGWPGLWQIELSRPPEGHGERQKLFVNNKEAGGVKTARYINIDGGKKLVFQWKNISLADEPGCMDVTATVSISAGRSPSSWTIDVDNRSRQWGTDSVTFPFLRTVCKSGTADVLLPTGAFGGTLSRNNTSSYEGYYPYWSCSVQFLAFNQGDAGLYVGAHDGEGYIKTLKLTNNQHVMIERMAENTGVPRSAKIPAYPVVVSAYQGDWWQAAKIYRAWALQQKWARKGWLAKREADEPAVRNFLNIGFWYADNAWPGSWASVDKVRQAVTDFNTLFAPLKVPLHWYVWHKIEFDTDYPEFFPARDGAGEIFKWFHDHQYGVMPYINAHLWNAHLPSFEKARPYAVKNPDGTILAETTGAADQPRLTAMCPYTPFWQQTIADICQRLMTDFDVAGIYLDQLGGTRAKPCYDVTHGHPTGGGNYWVQGYRKMLDGITQATGPRGAYLTSEMFAERQIDYINGFLTGHLYQHPNDVPLISAVYSGYATCFGCLESERDDMDTFSSLQGTAFLRGVQPGWLKHWVIEQPEKGNLARELALCRMSAKEFLVHGELVDDVRLDGSVDEINATVFLPYNKIASYGADFPSMRGSIWRTADGKSLGVVVMNMGGMPQRASFSVDISKYLQTSSGQPLDIYRILPEGEVFQRHLDASVMKTNLVLDAREVLILAIRPDDHETKEVASTQPGGTDVRLKTLAQAAEFDREMNGRKLDIGLENDLVQVVDADQVEAAIHVENGGDAPQEVQIRWPDGQNDVVAVHPKSRQVIQHAIILKDKNRDYSRNDIEAAVGGSHRKYTLFARQLPAIEIRLDDIAGDNDIPSASNDVIVLDPVDAQAERSKRGGMDAQPPGLHPEGHVNAVRGNRVNTLAITIQNHTKEVKTGSVSLVLPAGWKLVSGGQFENLAPGASVRLVVRVEVPRYAIDSLETIRATIDQHAVDKQVTVLKS